MATVKIHSPDKSNRILNILNLGKVKIRGQFIFGSNYSFLVQAKYQDEKIQAVYKPLRGEIPLWDFPYESLSAREVAAFRISQEIGWDFVPPTVIRKDGPLGEGSLQYFIPHNPKFNYFTFPKRFRNRLKRAAFFDLMINNADRKGSHILLDKSEKIWLIDHGLCFHTDPKLRTVIWDFSGQQIPNKLIRDAKNLLKKVRQGLPDLDELLRPEEIQAMIIRLHHLIRSALFPKPDNGHRPFPWPLV